MIQPCTGCGRPVLVHKIANLTVKCDPAPLTNVGDIVKLLTLPDPPALWMVEWNQHGQPVKLRGARPGEAGPVPEHRCVRVSGSRIVSATKETTPDPKGPQTGVQSLADPSTPSSAPWTDQSGAPAAASRRSEPRCEPTGSVGPSAPRCDACFKPCADGTYASISVGELTVWAQHVVGPCAEGR